MTKFDFEDGNGLVPAHEHPNGSGMVANTAMVDATAYVASNAWVYGKANVLGNAQVLGKAKVYGNAEVSGKAWVCGKVYDNARVYGDALVYGDAKVSGNAIVGGDIIIDVDETKQDRPLMTREQYEAYLALEKKQKDEAVNSIRLDADRVLETISDWSNQRHENKTEQRLGQFVVNKLLQSIKVTWNKLFNADLDTTLIILAEHCDDVESFHTTVGEGISWYKKTDGKEVRLQCLEVRLRCFDLHK